MSEQLSGAVKILAVDDDPSLLTLLAMRLSLEGYHVIEAKSAEEALVLMATQRPHLVITDLSMGGMDGLMLFDHLQHSYPTVPVILLTAYASVPLAVEAMRRGLFGFFTKPFEADALLAEVSRAIAQSPCPELNFDWNAAIITNNASMQAMLAELNIIAQYDTNILVAGASGTGKELVAQAVHKASPRRW